MWSYECGSSYYSTGICSRVNASFKFSRTIAPAFQRKLSLWILFMENAYSQQVIIFSFRNICFPRWRFSSLNVLQDVRRTWTSWLFWMAPTRSTPGMKYKLSLSTSFRSSILVQVKFRCVVGFFFEEWFFLSSILEHFCNYYKSLLCFTGAGRSASVWGEGCPWVQTEWLQIRWGSCEESTQYQPAWRRGDQYSTWHQCSAVGLVATLLQQVSLLQGAFLTTPAVFSQLSSF